MCTAVVNVFGQKNHILIFKNFFRNSKLTYSYPIEELDSGIEKMTPNKYHILWHTAIKYINLQQIVKAIETHFFKVSCILR